MIILDLIIIVLQIINVYLSIKLVLISRKYEVFNKFVKDQFWSMNVDIGKIKNKLKEFEDDLSI